MGTIPVRAGGGKVVCGARCAPCLGPLVGLFPEGSRADGRVGDARPGAALSALSGAPVVPAFIERARLDADGPASRSARIRAHFDRRSVFPPERRAGDLLADFAHARIRRLSRRHDHATAETIAIGSELLGASAPISTGFFSPMSRSQGVAVAFRPWWGRPAVCAPRSDALGRAGW